MLLSDLLRYRTTVADADGVVCPYLWIGTSLGSVLVVAFGLPTNGDRNTEPVSVMPSGMFDWHLSLSHDQLRAAPLIGQSAVTWCLSLFITGCSIIDSAHNAECQVPFIILRVTNVCRLCNDEQWSLLVRWLFWKWREELQKKSKLICYSIYTSSTWSENELLKFSKLLNF